MNESNNQACPRIYTRCPACHNDTLTINKGHLLCTWHDCPDPTLIERAGDRQPAPPESTGVKALASASGSPAAIEKERSLRLLMSEIIACINYQPEFPAAHKDDLVRALMRYEKASDAAQQENRELCHGAVSGAPNSNPPASAPLA